MAVSTNITSAAPYYDDFNTSGNDDKNYLRILFKPGVAVQTRELNQLQTAIQAQIDKFGSHVFQTNSRVLEGELSVSKVFSIDVTMASAYQTDANITANVLNKTISNADDSIEAKVIGFKNITGTSYKLFLRYTKSSDASNPTSLTAFTAPSYTKTFSANTAIDISGTNVGTITAIGNAVEYKINAGVYFTKGAFVRNEAQTIYIDLGATRIDYNGTPILQVSEKTVDALEDTSLLDNASGTINRGAPGADRYAINLNLKLLTDNATILGIDSNSDAIAQTGFSGDAIKLGDIQNGNVIEPLNYLYSEIGETMALRTFEESGNYALRPFQIDIREHLNNGTNRGRYITGGNSAKLAVEIEPSVAYVQGKRVELVNKKTVEMNKGRDTYSGLFGTSETISFQARKGNFIQGSSITGIPDSSATYELYSDASRIDSPAAATNNKIGTLKVSSVTYTGSLYNAYVNNISMDAGFELSDAKYLTEDSSPTNFEFSLNAGSKLGGFVLQETQHNTNIFPIGRQGIRDVTDLVYTVRAKTLSDYTGVSGTTKTFDKDNAQITSTHRFFSSDNNDYIVIDKATGLQIPLSSTVAPSLSASDATTGGFEEVTLTFASSQSSVDLQMIYSAKVAGTSITDGQKNFGGNETFAQASVTSITKNQRFNLNADIDVFEIVSVTHGSIDLTSDFVLDPGRTATDYNISHAVYVGETRTFSSGTLTITYKRFVHASTSGPFNVESYNINGLGTSNTAGTAVEYIDIPADGASNILTVADAIDFRGVDVSVDPNSTITAKVDYFLPRQDRIIIDKNGDVAIVSGISEIDPELPPQPQGSLLLYNLDIPPYTFRPSDVVITPFRNKRYTMKDIGRLEDRIKTLEYYTSLSMLERDAEGRQIFDNDGLRFNNGVLVDAFNGHGIGNATDSGYKCAIDPINSFLRPSYTQDNIGQFMGGPAGRTPADADVVGSRQAEPGLRLPAQTKFNLIDQPFASTAINVNPFDVAAFRGTIELTPSSDEWKSTERRPDVITNFDNNLDQLINVFNENEALGTIWNEWETNWTGRSRVGRSQGVTNNTGSGGAYIRTDFIQKTGERTRDGIRLNVDSNAVETDLGDRIVDVSFVPFIRSREVYFKGTGFKPNTRLIPFFDGVNIDIYTRSATSAEFETNTFADLGTRPSFEPFLNNSPSGISSSDVSGSIGITSDASGEVYGFFVIPNNNQLRFRTGERVFKLIDSTDVDDPNASTFSTAIYTAQGLINTVERNIISSRQLEITQDRISDRESIQEIEAKTVTYNDPLAQSFIIGEYKQGVMLRDIDLYFNAVDNDLPVSIHLVTVENGIPTQKIIPFSRVTKTATQMANQGSATASIATNFRFSQPIYLAFGQEYAIIVTSNSVGYTLWHSRVGGTDVNTGAVITKNPYAGVSFKSQNASTWTADQETDFKMTLRCVEFSETVSTAYSLTSILPQNRIGQAINDSPGSALNSHGMFLIAQDTRPQGTSVSYSLNVNDGTNNETYSVTPGKFVYFDNVSGGFNIDAASEVELTATLSSTNKYLTPTIDLDRLSLVSVTNVINNLSTDETNKNHGLANARYITKTVKLNNASTALDVYLGVNRPAGTDVKVYAQFNNPSNADETSPQSLNYVELQSNPIPINNSFDQYPEVNFRFSFTDDLTLGIEEFTEFKVKIVMLSSDLAKVPSCRELRCIATV